MGAEINSLHLELFEIPPGYFVLTCIQLLDQKDLAIHWCSHTMHVSYIPVSV